MLLRIQKIFLNSENLSDLNIGFSIVLDVGGSSYLQYRYYYKYISDFPLARLKLSWLYSMQKHKVSNVGYYSTDVLVLEIGGVWSTSLLPSKSSSTQSSRCSPVNETLNIQSVSLQNGQTLQKSCLEYDTKLHLIEELQFLNYGEY